MTLLGELTPLLLIVCAFLCTRGRGGVTAAAWIGAVLVVLEFIGFAVSYLLVGPMVEAAKEGSSGVPIFSPIACVMSAAYGAWYPATLLSDKWRAQFGRFHLWAHFAVAPCALLFPRFSSYDEIARVLLSDGASLSCLIFIWYSVMRLRKVEYA